MSDWRNYATWCRHYRQSSRPNIGIAVGVMERIPGQSPASAVIPIFIANLSSLTLESSGVVFKL
nr:hypothetical protein [Budvicia aquatica]